MQKRIKWVDVVRGIAICMVVLCHSVEAIYNFNTHSIMERPTFEAITGLAYFTLGRLGVPLFLMISGYLLLNREYHDKECLNFWKNNVLHLYICTVIWFIIYDLYLVLIGVEKFSIMKLVSHLLFLGNVNLDHTWYMPMILGMYILIPFVANALHSLNKKLIIVPVMIYTFYTFICTDLNRAAQLLIGEKLNVTFSLGFSGAYYGIYLILGYAKGFLQKVRSNVLTIISAVSFIGAVFEQYLVIGGARSIHMV